MLENFEKKQNSLKGSNLVFDGVDLTYVQFIRLKTKRAGSDIPTPVRYQLKKQQSILKIQKMTVVLHSQ